MKIKMIAINYSNNKTKSKNYDVPCKLDEKTYNKFETKSNKLIDDIITSDYDDFGFYYEFDNNKFYNTDDLFSNIRQRRI